MQIKPPKPWGLFIFDKVGFSNQYIQNANTIISSYDGHIPFHHFIKQYLSSNKKFGSKDRKAITNACYCYYRLGKSLKDIPLNEKIKTGIYLCQNEPGHWKEIYSDGWIKNWTDDLLQRVNFVSSVYSFDEKEIFTWQNELSEQINNKAFTISHLIQPNLYLRIRPAKESKVKQRLIEAGIAFEITKDCVTLPNATKIENVVVLNKDVVVQDLSSQRIADFFPINQSHKTLKIWDCCAASGGKSLLAYDHLSPIEITASDIRPSIIHNLEKRFTQAGIDRYRSLVLDVTDNETNAAAALHTKFDLIICDAPCTGSGTWGRTPEQLTFFDPRRISEYAALQKQIAFNALQHMNIQGHFLYITCSVFKQENEEIVNALKEKFHLDIVKMELIKGYDKKADTMFAALLRKPAIAD